jgi:hypothetical protein
MTAHRHLRLTPDTDDPTSSFRCFDCGETFALPETGEPDDALICTGCRKILGAFATYDAQRLERRWIITSGRPDKYKP